MVTPAWDIDGNPQSFSDSELQRIQYMWQRVAEDYACFDVDVTTEALPEDRITKNSSNDEYYGVRALISPISSYFGNYGGIAYVGVFSYTGDYYSPALIFPEKLSNSEKYIAEAISHEIGHNLGLNHDGLTSGTTYYQGHGSNKIGWAPIMGVGYYRNLVQWSKGEYTGANNTEDDLAKILQYGNFDYQPDDHGNGPSSATWLTPQSNTITAQGIIEQSSDADVFAFVTGAGQISLNALTTDRGPNLDILLRLYDADNVLVTSNNPPSTLGAGISASVAEGTYYLNVSGVGNENCTDYASLGQYTVNGTILSSGNSLPPVAQASAEPVSGNGSSFCTVFKQRLD